MKLVYSFVAVTLVGAFGEAVCALAQTSHSAVAGVFLSTAVGLGVLALKAWLARAGKGGLQNVKMQLGSVAVSFAFRMVAAGGGAFALRARGEAIEGFLIAFFACYVAQQFIEVRYVLGAYAPAMVASPEVGR